MAMAISCSIPKRLTSKSRLLLKPFHPSSSSAIPSSTFFISRNPNPFFHFSPQAQAVISKFPLRNPLNSAPISPFQSSQGLKPAIFRFDSTKSYSTLRPQSKNPSPFALGKCISGFQDLLIPKPSNFDLLCSRSYASSGSTRVGNPYPDWVSDSKSKCFSTSHPSPDDEKPQNREFKHQEVEGGPTVECDTFALQGQIVKRLELQLNLIIQLSNALALMGLFQLALGAWISYITRASPIPEVTILSISSVLPPLLMAFLMRRWVKLILRKVGAKRVAGFDSDP